VLDPNGVLRRHLLAMEPSPASRCTASYALSTQLAFRYLEAEGISPKFTSDGILAAWYYSSLNAWKLVLAVTKTLMPGVTKYCSIIALTIRSQDFAPQVTLTQVLKGQLNPDAVKDRIVLIGVTAPSAKDYFFTPYSAAHRFEQKMPGVVVQAQMVSQIISAVLDQAIALVGLVWLG
jgi:CHASE2 domain-containing sensor protein